ncbi:UDP-N-acetyl-D-mannosamine dehydrogenase [Microbulbifer magnicolonia]|uniref:UDP-N-acetyl-D-mannosamine dehydrogenase n=1 Tax=Microbulbifer magnicolonia TaxID=3109744 RepID=UPI002B407F9C|nr:UDP-N-acetyl-D-mannosamine dehydrogenase [Microbulbifer sp. GG15]
MNKKMNFQSLTVMGLGYIGLPTAAAFASRKLKVCGVDINEKAVNTINRGEIHIVEPELDIVVHSTVTEGFLKASLTPESADAFIIAVPTPFKENKEPDLSYIEAAASAIAPVIKKGDLIILESTSPVGATEHMAKGLAEFRPDLNIPVENRARGEFDVFIAHCPERVLPGHVMKELVENDRIIGGMTASCAEKAKALYQVLVEGRCYLTDVRTAEMAKLTENSFRDVNIAFANELSIICDELSINVWDLIRLANKHPRVNILRPGAGVGGHCIAVDPWFIVSQSPAHANLIKTAREVNDYKPNWVIQKVEKEVQLFLSKNPNIHASKVKIACLGLAFKPDIDDLRESPALQIARELEAQYPKQVTLVEPNVEEIPNGFVSKLEHDIERAIEVSDVIAVLVPHSQFKEHAKLISSQAHVVDATGLNDLEI